MRGKTKSAKSQNSPPSWDMVERQIHKEVAWLRNSIDLSPLSGKEIPLSY